MKCSPRVEGLFLHHPGRRQMPAALRGLIDMIRAPLQPAVELAAAAA